ncbi:MAG: hypothetical protein Kow0077_24880 [Anaerolineae bacterium]
MISKPIVDGIEADLAGQAEVIRLDILSDFGRQTAGRFGVQAVPTVLIVDGQGNITDRIMGIPNRDHISSAALALIEN